MNHFLLTPPCEHARHLQTFVQSVRRLGSGSASASHELTIFTKSLLLLIPHIIFSFSRRLSAQRMYCLVSNFWFISKEPCAPHSLFHFTCSERLNDKFMLIWSWILIFIKIFGWRLWPDKLEISQTGTTWKGEQFDLKLLWPQANSLLSRKENENCMTIEINNLNFLWVYAGARNTPIWRGACIWFCHILIAF